MFRRVLTPRQQQVARCLVDGYSHQQIAVELRISIWTVKKHACDINLRLGGQGRARRQLRRMFGLRIA